ncbi:glycosyltransferase family 25 protein [Ustulina deusta]|nr:glycosyltransferase family 25 protein [Ustulina deusta]
MASDNALGFSKKIGIGLPGRMNKRDALALTGPPHHVLCGIHRRCPRENKALPIGLDRQARGRESVELESPYERREKQVAEGTCNILPTSTRTSSQYADNWDVLSWVSNCGETFLEALPENLGKPECAQHTMYSDETVPPLSKIADLLSYALSQDDARNVLPDHLKGAFGNALAGPCRDGVSYNTDWLQAKCISVTPPVFFHHRAKNHVTGDRTTEKIIWSARNYIRNAMLGLTDNDGFLSFCVGYCNV